MAREKGMGNLQQEKSGRWTARICVNGLKICRSTRTKDRAQAEAYLMRLLAPFGRGEKRLALADVWRMYEKSPKRRDLAPATIVSKRGVWMHFASWMEVNHPEIVQLKQLSQEIVGEYLRVLRIDHCASTYNNRVCVLREICRVLADDAGIVDDPWEGVQLLADDSHTRREFTREELQRILEASKNADALRRTQNFGRFGVPTPRANVEGSSFGGIALNARSAQFESAEVRATGEWQLLFLLGIYTGQRLGDCCTLRWCDVKEDRGIIQLVPRKTRKHLKGHPVTIPIHPALREALDECRVRSAECEGENSEWSDYVLPMMAEWYLSNERWRISSGLEEIFKKAKIKTSVKLEGRKTATPDATFHSLRHTFVSFTVNGGVPLPVVQSIVGHTSNAMTRHYYHENVDALRAAVAAIPPLGSAEKEVLSAGCGVRGVGVQSGLTFPPEKIEEMRRIYESLKAVFG